MVVVSVCCRGSTNNTYLAPIFFAISFVYSSVGFAGGSSYIAILVLAGVSLYAVPPISLALNVIAPVWPFINYARARYFSLKFSLPFLSSLPFVFFAGLLYSRKKSCPYICNSIICRLQLTPDFK